MHICNRARWKSEIHECDVRHVRNDAAATYGRHRGRLLAEPIPKNREVVRTEVPDDTHIRLVQPEIHPARRDEVDLAEVTRMDEVADDVDGRAIEEGVRGHQR